MTSRSKAITKRQIQPQVKLNPRQKRSSKKHLTPIRSKCLSMPKKIDPKKYKIQSSLKNMSPEQAKYLYNLVMRIKENSPLLYPQDREDHVKVEDSIVLEKACFSTELMDSQFEEQTELLNEGRQPLIQSVYFMNIEKNKTEQTLADTIIISSEAVRKRTVRSIAVTFDRLQKISEKKLSNCQSQETNQTDSQKKIQLGH